MENFVKRIIWIVISYIALVFVITALLELTIARNQDVYNNLAVSIIVSWLLILVVYYIWAIYYYNFNFGLEDAHWEEIKEVRKTDPEKAKKMGPDGNPFAEQTLGLPPGTIRGTLALSLMVTGLAVVIASLSMKSTLGENEFFIDNFEFFKTAFLMMIAFYFGNKSLEFLKDRKKFYKNEGKGNTSKMPVGTPPESPVNNSVNDAKDELRKTDDG